MNQRKDFLSIHKIVECVLCAVCVAWNDVKSVNLFMVNWIFGSISGALAIWTKMFKLNQHCGFPDVAWAWRTKKLADLNRDFRYVLFENQLE